MYIDLIALAQSRESYIAGYDKISSFIAGRHRTVREIGAGISELAHAQILIQEFPEIERTLVHCGEFTY